MRVITGTARGKKLFTPQGRQVRPTAERVKEAVFSMLHFSLPQSICADLFCGSGQMGIEALSRGAQRAYFVDMSNESICLTKKNLDVTGLASSAQVICGDCAQFLARTGEKFDLVFMDPPYGHGYPEKILPLIGPAIKPEGFVLCETRKDDTMPAQTGGLELVRQQQYGTAKISVYRLAATKDETGAVCP